MLLNDDCILHVASFLRIQESLRFAATSTSLRSTALQSITRILVVHHNAAPLLRHLSRLEKISITTKCIPSCWPKVVSRRLTSLTIISLYDVLGTRHARILASHPKPLLTSITMDTRISSKAAFFLGKVVASQQVIHLRKEFPLQALLHPQIQYLDTLSICKIDNHIIDVLMLTRRLRCLKLGAMDDEAMTLVCDYLQRSNAPHLEELWIWRSWASSLQPLIRALEQGAAPTLRRIKIGGCLDTNDDGQGLTRCLAQRPIERIDIGTYVEHKTIKTIVSQEMPHLRTLHVESYGRITGISLGLRGLHLPLASMINLRITQVPLDMGDISILLSALQQIEILGLVQCGMTFRGIAVLSHHLRNLSRLRQLNVNRNKFSLSSLYVLLCGVVTHPTLEKVEAYSHISHSRDDSIRTYSEAQTLLETRPDTYPHVRIFAGQFPNINGKRYTMI